WPAIYPELLKLVDEHRSTLIFVNNRRSAERLALRLNDLSEHEIARAHHGSLAREERLVVEEMLKAGELPCLVATSSLELGIDMGAVDLVIQVESPKSVARGLQRIGRAGHSVGDVSRGRIFTQFRAELRPRIVCDRVARTIRARPGARQLAVTNAGTIPDRGLYAVTLPDGRRVGELDEEMVYETRPGQTFLLGATTWRIEEIGRDRVVVTPAPGLPGAVPFWKGDGVGRPKELGEAIGAFARWAVEQTPERLIEQGYDLDERAARNLVDFLREQQAATRVVPARGSSALFGAGFRENAARALLIPRARPGRRTPL